MSSKKSLISRLRWIFGVFLLLNIVFLIVINMLSFNDLKTHVVEINEQALENVTDDWNESINNVGSYIMNITYQERESLDVIMKGTDKDSIEYILAYNELRKRFQNDLIYIGDMSAYFVYIEQLDDVIYVSLRNDDKFITDIEKVTNVCGANGAWCLVDHDNINYLAKAINVGYSTYIGAILDVSDIVTPLRELYPDEGLSFRLTDRDNNLLYSDRSGDTNSDLSIESEIQTVDVKIQEMIPSSYVYSRILNAQFILLACISACMIVLLLIIYMVQYNAIQKPIQSLINSVKKVDSGIIDARVDEQGSYEFDYLISSYNHMLDKIYDLKLNIAETELNKKYLELMQLQAQINPHFFMNSLNLISGLSALQDYDNTLKLVRLLSDYFRFAVRNNEICISISKEVEHVKTCLEIHKIRFPQNLDYECIVDEDVKDLMIPPLTIQPLTENSIIHGFRHEKNVIFKITVKVEKKDGTLRITVSDNGNGFTEDAIKYIKDGLGDSRKTEHIGIQNVYLRLNIFFDGGVSMDFRNNDTGGAEVIITIPENKLREAD